MKWISLDIKPFYSNPTFLIILVISILFIIFSLLWNTRLRIEIKKSKVIQEEKEKLINDLQIALEKIKTLTGLVPICAQCKKIRNEKGVWKPIEAYIESHTDALFSHGICPECEKKIYGDKNWYKKNKEK